MTLSAEEKRNYLWHKIMENTAMGSYPNPVLMPGLFLESMSYTFETPGDLMPSNMFGLKLKYLNSVGVVGKVKFIPNIEANRFKGIFQGADKGIIRLSSALEPSEK